MQEVVSARILISVGISIVIKLKVRNHIVFCERLIKDKGASIAAPKAMLRVSVHILMKTKTTV